MKMWRVRGVRLIPYIDDFLFRARLREEVLELRAQILKDMAVLR